MDRKPAIATWELWLVGNMLVSHHSIKNRIARPDQPKKAHARE
jgi:hypothetical protein